MEAEGLMSMVVKLDNDCVFESRKTVMKKKRKKAIDWDCDKKHGLLCKNCSRYSCIDCCLLVRGVISTKLQESNPWCGIVKDVSQSQDHVKMMEKCHGCEYGVENRLEIYEDEEESEEIGYVGEETYENDLEFLMSENKEQEEESYSIFAEGDKMVDEVTSYSIDESSVNERTKKRTKLTVNEGINSSPTKYLGYLYYHRCYLLIDSPTKEQVDIHGVGRVKNKNYASEVGIPHCVLSRESCG